MSNPYETMYVLRPDLNDEQIQEAIAKYSNLMTSLGASDLEIKVMGRRRLAYMIKKMREGIYVLVNYHAPGSHVAPMQRTMRLSDDVIRFITIKLEEVAPKPELAELAVTEA